MVKRNAIVDDTVCGTSVLLVTLSDHSVLSWQHIALEMEVST